MNKILVVALAVAVATAGVGVWYVTLPKLEVKDIHRDLTLFVSLDRADFGRNDPIVVKVRLKNTSPTAPFDVGFNGSTVGSLRFNIAFYSENGRMVYNWTARQPVKREYPLYIIRLNPGSEIAETVTWDRKDDSGNLVSSGRYYVVVSTVDFLYDYRPGYGDVYVLQSGYNEPTFLAAERLYLNLG